MRMPMKTKERTIWIMAPCWPSASVSLCRMPQDSRIYIRRWRQSTNNLMEKNAEIQLARSAAPDSISRDATILVLGRQGYETAVEGKNGFVCMVERGWMGMFDWPEFWSPKVRAADCLNPQAARSILPLGYLRDVLASGG